MEIRHIPPDWLHMTSYFGGSQTWIAYGTEIRDYLARSFWWYGLCLKLLHPTRGRVWEGVDLIEVSEVQNLCAHQGLAPYVWAVAHVNEMQWGQVVEFLGGGRRRPPVDRANCLRQLLIDSGVGTRKTEWVGGPPKWDMNHAGAYSNWIEGRFLDFGGLYFRSRHPEWEVC